MDEITIYDIAKKAGVSASTVSRVINNYQYVRKSTRDRVLKVLESCNYIPNETARNLVNQSTKMVGILIADIRTTHHTEGVYYVEHEFYKKGYSCLIYNTGIEPDNVVHYIQLLSQKKIEAVVLMGSVYQNDIVAKAISTYLPNTPVAICNGFIDAKNVYGVVSDEKNGVIDCVKFLASKGLRNAAFVYNRITPSNQEKIDGFLLGCLMYMKEGDNLVIDGGESIESQIAATIDLISNNLNVDSIIYSEDYVAMIGLHALHNMGKKVPEDISIIGINNSKEAMISIPALTSLDNMLYETSLMAVRNILHVLEGEPVAQKIILGTKIVERESTRSNI